MMVTTTVANESITLFSRRSFLAFFITQFLGAFNDNLFKTALSLLIAFNISQQNEVESSVLVNLAAICFILPFFIFSPRAGGLADRMDKVSLIRIIKACEVMIMTVALIGFYLNNAWFLILVLFFMGTQSAFFGPLKYSYLPMILARDELVGANAWIQASTFIGIICGMMLAGILFSLSNEHNGAVMIAVVTTALLGYIASRFIPRNRTTVNSDKNEKDSMLALIKLAREHRPVWISILGISWFWMVGATYITQLPNYVRFYAIADEQVFLFCLTLFALGIGVGSLICAWLNKKQRAQGLGKYSVLMGLSGLILAGLIVAFYPSQAKGTIRSLAEFGSTYNDIQLIVGLFVLGLSGGLYIVPLYTVLQTQSNDLHRSRMVAVNNIFNALYMVLSAILALGLLASGITIGQLFMLLAIANLFMLYFYIRQNSQFLFAVTELYR